jgi:hypothetical protein
MSMTSTDMGDSTRRQTDAPLELLRAALGSRRDIARKLAALQRTLRTWGNSKEIERRLSTLEARGFIARRPTRAQLAFGALDMFRFVIVPSARDYYASRGIDFRFHQVLRFLDDPVSVIDPTGLLSERDTIIGHVMQVVHLNPIYDLQLLQMFEDGLSELEAQVQAMVEGTHPRAGTIGAVVEDPGYHARLLDYVRRFRAGEAPPDLMRPSSLRDDPHYAAAERSFASMPGYIAYCNALPKRARALALRLAATRRFPVEMEPVEVTRA